MKTQLLAFLLFLSIGTMAQDASLFPVAPAMPDSMVWTDAPANNVQFRFENILVDSSVCERIIVDPKISRGHFEYDEYGYRRTETSFTTMDGDTLQGSRRLYPGYVANGPAATIYQVWDLDSKTFKPTTRSVEYNHNPEEVWRSTGVWDVATSSWMENSKTYSSYNEKGLHISTTSLLLNDTTQQLQPKYRWDSFYSDDDKITSRKTYEWLSHKKSWKFRWHHIYGACELEGYTCHSNFYNTDDRGWVGTTRSLIKIDDDPNAGERIEQFWSEASEEWQNKERFVGNNSQDTLFSTNYNWEPATATWGPENRTISITTDYSRKYIQQFWNSTTNTWRDIFHQFNFYYPDMVGDTTIHESREMNSSIWDTTYFRVTFLNDDAVIDSLHSVSTTNYDGGVHSCKYYYTKREITPYQPPIIDTMTCVFANPYDPITNIRCQFPAETNSEYLIQLFNLNGQRMASHLMPENGLFSYADYDLPAGIYVLRIMRGKERVFLKKICIIPRWR